MNLDRRLMAYTAAAAAGLATADSADAVPIYSSGFTFSNGSTHNINFDNAGNEEFVFAHRSAANRVQLLKDDQTIDANAYRITAANSHPAALTAGTAINAGSTYGNTYDATLANAEDGAGNFTIDNIDGNPEYVGVRFQLTDGGPLFYGWIGVDINNENDLSGRVTGFAYESSGGPIAAGAIPEPAGLALLALGAPFLLRRRRQGA